MKLERRLLFSFLHLIAVALLLGLIGFYSLAKVDDSLETMRRSLLPDLLSLQRIEEAASDILVAERGIADASVPPPAHWYQYRRLDEAWRRAEYGIKNFIPAKEEQLIWNNFLSLWTEWRLQHEQIRQLSEAGKFGEAHRLAERYEKTPFAKPLNHLIRLHLRDVEQRIVRTHARQTNHLYFLAFAIAVSVLMSVLLSLTLARSFTEPIRACIEWARAIGKGDLTAQIEHEREDELGELIDELNGMASFLRKMFGEIDENMNSLTVLASGLSGLSDQMEESPRPLPTMSRVELRTMLDEMQTQVSLLQGLAGGLSTRMEEFRKGMSSTPQGENDLGKIESSVRDHAFDLELMSRRLKLLLERFRV
ncbi:MAG: MCP four helix bundle domain-containing protein [Bacteroidota bacterium]